MQLAERPLALHTLFARQNLSPVVYRSIFNFKLQRRLNICNKFFHEESKVKVERGELLQEQKLWSIVRASFLI